MTPLPPIRDLDGLRMRLACMPEQIREDATQEAWVAHLSGDNVLAAVDRFSKREKAWTDRRVEFQDQSASQRQSIPRRHSAA